MEETLNPFWGLVPGADPPLEKYFDRDGRNGVFWLLFGSGLG